MLLASALAKLCKLPIGLPVPSRCSAARIMYAAPLPSSSTGPAPAAVLVSSAMLAGCSNHSQAIWSAVPLAMICNSFFSFTLRIRLPAMAPRFFMSGRPGSAFIIGRPMSISALSRSRNFR